MAKVLKIDKKKILESFKEAGFDGGYYAKATSVTVDGCTYTAKRLSGVEAQLDGHKESRKLYKSHAAEYIQESLLFLYKNLDKVDEVKNMIDRYDTLKEWSEIADNTIREIYKKYTVGDILNNEDVNKLLKDKRSKANSLGMEMGRINCKINSMSNHKSNIHSIAGMRVALDLLPEGLTKEKVDRMLNYKYEPTKIL